MCLYGLSSWPLQTPNVSLVFKPVFQSVLVQALNRAGFKPFKNSSWGLCGESLAVVGMTQPLPRDPESWHLSAYTKDTHHVILAHR